MNGILTIPSRDGAKETMGRLEIAARARGMTIFGRIDHGAGAMQAGLALNPVEVLVFGNPRAGTPLMQASPFIGIDLPLRALVWEDDVGQTWITSIDPTWLVARYQLASANIQRVVQEMTGSQSDIVRSAASGG